MASQMSKLNANLLSIIIIFRSFTGWQIHTTCFRFHDLSPWKSYATMHKIGCNYRMSSSHTHKGKFHLQKCYYSPELKRRPADFQCENRNIYYIPMVSQALARQNKTTITSDAIHIRKFIHNNLSFLSKIKRQSWWRWVI